MDQLSTRTLVSCAALYCGIALFLHFVGISDYFKMPPGREDLIASMALASPVLILQFLGFALAILALNLLPLVLLLVGLRRIAPRFGLNPFIVFFLATVCLWLAAFSFNKLYFPRSSFGLLLPIDDPAKLRWIGYGSLPVYVALGVAPALWGFMPHLQEVLRIKVTRVALGAILALSLIYPLQSNWLSASAPSRQPDVIIIGIDSMSPLHMQHHADALPYLRKLLADSTVFSNTITPLARTFPAWTSILTGRYPVHTGARFNLTNFDQVDTRATLARILKAQGYATIYAQDERKFNNLDESFGFDATVGPKPGAAEFVMTKMSDQPLVNLALLSSWGKKLFPFIALNRADDIHYEPSEFVAAVVDQIPNDRSKPLFLATHFCLAHYPYMWRNQNRPDKVDQSNTMDAQHIYALGFLERQIAGLIQALKDRGRLDNAILVLLSDHGEALSYSDGYWPSVRGYTNTHDPYLVDGVVPFSYGSGFTGHGTDTLDHTQYQSMLAFQGFGAEKAKFTPRTDGHLTSLVDIMPTLLSALNLKIPANVDGMNLLAAPPPPGTRTVPAETGMRFAAIASLTAVDEDDLLRESQEFYTVDHDSARLIIKPDHYAELVHSKDLAIHTHDWMLALLRNNHNRVFPRVAVLVYKPTGAWTTGNDAALIKQAPMALLTKGLQRIYGRELEDFKAQWPFAQAPKPDGSGSGMKVQALNPAPIS